MDPSNDPSEVMTFAGLYEIGERAFQTTFLVF